MLNRNAHKPCKVCGAERYKWHTTCYECYLVINRETVRRHRAKKKAEFDKPDKP